MADDVDSELFPQRLLLCFGLGVLFLQTLETREHCPKERISWLHCMAMITDCQRNIYSNGALNQVQLHCNTVWTSPQHLTYRQITF